MSRLRSIEDWRARLVAAFTIVAASILGLPALAGDPPKSEVVRGRDSHGDEARGDVDGGRVDFGTEIRPLLVEHCVGCHGGVQQAADVSFTHPDLAMRVIEAGDPAASTLVARIRSEDPYEVMPPPEHGRRLNPEEVQLFERWIRQGAAWEQPWAYVAPKSPATPEVVDPSWCRDPLDRFVLRRLDQESLLPADDAPPAQWLRRATLDLTGLPPTPAEVRRFRDATQRQGDSAYAAAVDRLLDSDGFGHRWASVWLDQVRYADSRGLGADGRRRIWKYRDWVIDALNDDMPFDEFTIKQIAGDLLPDRSIEDLVATAAHRLTQTNEEGGTDDEEFRVAAVLDRVSTVWQAWQGITFGCVQCHSHPYDPIGHEEFYQFAAFFNNTADSDLSEELPTVAVPKDPAEVSRAEQLDREIRALTRDHWQAEYALLGEPPSTEQAKPPNSLAKPPNSLAKPPGRPDRAGVVSPRWNPVTRMEAGANKSTRVVVKTVTNDRFESRPSPPTGDTPTSDTPTSDTRSTRATRRPTRRAEYHTVDTVSNNTDIVLTAAIPAGVDRITAVRVACLPSDPESAVADSEWGFVLSHVDFAILDPEKPGRRGLKIARVIGDEPFPMKDPQESLNPKSRDGFAAYSRIHHRRHAAFVLDEPVEVSESAQLIVTLKHRVVAVGAFALVARRGQLAVSSSDVFGGVLGSPEHRLRGRRLAALRADRATIDSVAIPVLGERPEHLARPTHVFTRGLFLTKGDRVTPDVPDAFPSLAPEASRGRTPNRLDLAHWLVSDANPLTARVTVNRFWSRLFGVGLVATEEDFGSSGEAPSHPELLDHLAVRFRQDYRWRVKPLLRAIVLSSTYRQDATRRGDVEDPTNRLLSRGPRFRLPAEMIRDQGLFVAGLLHDAAHGPPVFPPLPPQVWKPFQGGDKWKTPEAGAPNRYRRAIYTYTKRSIPYPMFASFDAPSREFCAPRRLRSNTPLQALMMLNDTTFVECAAALGRRMHASAETPRERIEFGFLAVTGRLPSDRETSVLVDLLDSERSMRDAERAGNPADNPADVSDVSDVTAEDASDDAACYTAVASVLLNLDEATNK